MIRGEKKKKKLELMDETRKYLYGVEFPDLNELRKLIDRHRELGTNVTEKMKGLYVASLHFQDRWRGAYEMNDSRQAELERKD